MKNTAPTPKGGSDPTISEQILKSPIFKHGEKAVDFAYGPGVDVAKRALAAEYEIFRAIDALQHGQVDPKHAAPNPFMSEQRLTEMSDPKTAALRTAQTSAGLASYAVPGGKFTAPLASKEAAKQLFNIALRGGAKWGTRGASRPDSTPGSIVDASLFGAATAPLGALGARGIKNVWDFYNQTPPTQHVDYSQVGNRGVADSAPTIDPKTGETVFVPRGQEGFIKLGPSAPPRGFIDPKGKVVPSLGPHYTTAAKSAPKGKVSEFLQKNVRYAELGKDLFIESPKPPTPTQMSKLGEIASGKRVVFDLTGQESEHFFPNFNEFAKYISTLR